jgi:hypothetical protein
MEYGGTSYTAGTFCEMAAKIFCDLKKLLSKKLLDRKKIFEKRHKMDAC